MAVKSGGDGPMAVSEQCPSISLFNNGRMPWLWDADADAGLPLADAEPPLPLLPARVREVRRLPRRELQRRLLHLLPAPEFPGGPAPVQPMRFR